LPEPAPRVTNVLTVDVEEYYHGVEFSQALGPDALARLPSRVVAETEHLLDVLDEYRARATFFTLGVVARRFQRLARAIVARGHEIASHGWDHTPVWQLGAEAFRADVKRARHTLEQAAGSAVRGYRAPNYSIRRDTPWAFAILYEEGHSYDSSVYPVRHDRYGFPEAPRFPHVAATFDGVDFWEVPVGTARFAGTNLPIGGGFFRLFPAAFGRAALARVNRHDRRPCVLYVHPWEFDPGQPRTAMPWVHRFRHYAGIESAEKKLCAILAEFSFTTIDAAFPHVAPARLGIAPLAAS
jgi:polysaccharide deacetylase family protein (PEP-CTERM system associated)